MSKGETIKATRPANGCARCIWWVQGKGSCRGRCHIWKRRTYYRAPACPEYELDPAVGDGIEFEKDEQ